MDWQKILQNIDKLDESKFLKELDVLEQCNLCPRNCNANRFSGKFGYCNAGTGFSISSICNHRGEEPVISGPYGICNIFFTNCNLQCVYCQNYQISQNTGDYRHDNMDFKTVLREIVFILMNSGMKIVGFVSPGHFIPHMKAIIKALNSLGLELTYVYNSNGFDKVETLKELEGLIDVYMPDFKYADNDLSEKLSGAKDYTEIALKALKEMYRQIGNAFIVDNSGYLMRGILIRHLVLPSHAENSKEVLKMIADVSLKLHISLMSQYQPNIYVKDIPGLSGTVKSEEYYEVVDFMQQAGFTNAYIQEMSSAANYNPDFRKNHPFERM
ncbi:radical SAM protein [Bacteroidota bacterium]